MKYEIISGEILNATSSQQMWASLTHAALEAHRKLKKDGFDNFSVKVEVDDGGYTLKRVAYGAYMNFIRIATECAHAKIKPESMSMEQKLAVCVACGVPLDTDMSNALMLKTKTRFPCAILLEDSGYRVRVQQGQTIELNETRRNAIE